MNKLTLRVKKIHNLQMRATRFHSAGRDKREVMHIQRQETLLSFICLGSLENPTKTRLINFDQYEVASREICKGIQVQ